MTKVCEASQIVHYRKPGLGIGSTIPSDKLIMSIIVGVLFISVQGFTNLSLQNDVTVMLNSAFQITNTPVSQYNSKQWPTQSSVLSCQIQVSLPFMYPEAIKRILDYGNILNWNILQY